MGTVFGAVICTHCRLLLPFPSPTWPLPFLVPLFASLVVLPCSLSFCLACRLVPPLLLASGCSRNFLPCLRLFFLLVVPVWLLLPALSRPYWPFFCSVATVRGSFVLFAFCLEAIATKLQLQPPQHPKNKTKQQQQQKKKPPDVFLLCPCPPLLFQRCHPFSRCAWAAVLLFSSYLCCHHYSLYFSKPLYFVRHPSARVFSARLHRACVRTLDLRCKFSESKN